MTFLSATNLADLTGTSLATAQKWGESGVYPYHKNEKGKEGFYMEELTDVEPVRMMLETNWDEEFHVAPLRAYTSVELFAGAGGLALGVCTTRPRDTWRQAYGCPLRRDIVDGVL